MGETEQIDSPPLLQVENLTVEFPATGNRKVQAVSGVSFTIAPGETLGLVGESGCGKSSLARAIMLLPQPTAGRIIFNGKELTAVHRQSLRYLRSGFQMIFQDPVASFNPVRSIGESVATPLRTMWGVSATERTQRARDMLTAVGLDPEQHFERRPAQLSGGQCQRASIARALITDPFLLICDEPVSALDVSVQAQIINLLQEVQRERGLALLFISHDLAVVKNISDRVAVMYLGRLCEIAPCGQLYALPAHPYTRALLDAVPRPDPGYRIPESSLHPGELPSPMDPPSGCRFRTRCPRARNICTEVQPELREISPGHLVACHFPLTGNGEPRS
jgi:peptide/nickel transport system ATP-binding protein